MRNARRMVRLRDAWNEWRCEVAAPAPVSVVVAETENIEPSGGVSLWDVCYCDSWCVCSEEKLRRSRERLSPSLGDSTRTGTSEKGSQDSSSDNSDLHAAGEDGYATDDTTVEGEPQNPESDDEGQLDCQNHDAEELDRPLLPPFDVLGYVCHGCSAGCMDCLPEFVPLPPASLRELFDFGIRRLPTEWQTELIQRIARRAEPVVDTTPIPERLNRAACDWPPLSLNDPLRPPEFVRRCREAGASEEGISAAWKKYLQSEMADEDREPVEKAMRDHQRSLDRLFTSFLRRSCSITVPGLARFEKKLADRALSGAIGSVSSRGNHRFVYGNLSLDMTSMPEASAAWSIYMARKGLTCPNPFQIEGNTAATVSRLTTPAPPCPNPIARQRMFRLLSRLLPLIFPDPSAARARATCPNSGKACLESSYSLGGKRSVLLALPQDPELGGPHPAYQTRAAAVAQFRAKWGALPTVPVTILSGGKLRGISTTSVEISQYDWINEYLFKEVRKCKWSIAGRSVQDWIWDNLDIINYGDTWVSGDLAAATDYLSGDIARIVLGHIAKKAYPERHAEARRELLNSTTDAYLARWNEGVLEPCTSSPASAEALAFLTTQPRMKPQCRLPVELLNEILLLAGLDASHARYPSRQVRGQLMASTPSFPILCLSGFLIGVEHHAMTESLLAMSDEDLTAQFYSWDRHGTNGDDYVTRSSDPERWVSTVLAVDGVPEPVKSPCDPFFFTVNSELWAYTAWQTPGSAEIPCAYPVQVPALLPAQLYHLHNGISSVPDYKWLPVLTSIAPPGSAVARSLGIDLILKPDLPRSYGGLDVSCRHPSLNIAAARIAYALSSLDPVYETRSLRYDSSASLFLKVSKGDTEICFEPRDQEPQELVPGWYDYVSLSEFRRERFGAPWGMKYDSRKYMKRVDVDKITRAKLKDPKHTYEDLIADAVSCSNWESEGLAFGWASALEVKKKHYPISRMSALEHARWSGYTLGIESKRGIGARSDYQVPLSSERIAYPTLIAEQLAPGVGPKVPFTRTSNPLIGTGPEALAIAWKSSKLRPRFNPDDEVEY